MKKFFALTFSVLLTLGSVTVSMAAPVTISGNLRTWIQNSTNGAGSTNTTFAFDRLCLDINADLGKNNGLKNELQIRSLKTNTLNDLRFETYYYQKNALMQGDELDFGALGLTKFMPFKGSYINATQVVGGLGGGLGTINNVGAIYSYNQPKYDFALGIANNRPMEDWNTAGEGFNTYMRVNYQPVTGLKVGAGYEIVANKGATLYDPSYNRDNRLVVDASYVGTPLSGIIEYAMDTPVVNGVTGSNLSAVYGELSYKKGVWQLYAARGVNTAGNLIGKMGQSNASSLQGANNNYYVVGTQYTLSSGPILGVEYLKVDTGGNSLGLRCRVNF